MVLITDGNVSDITCPDGHCKKQGRLESPEVSAFSLTGLGMFSMDGAVNNK